MKSPVPTLAILTTFALGLSALTAVYSIVQAVLLNPLGFPHVERLVMLAESNRTSGARYSYVSSVTFAAWRDRSSVFEKLAITTWSRVNLTGGIDPEQVLALSVTKDFFDVIGVRPRLGRAFETAEFAEGSNRSVVLSDSLWRNRFGGDRAILGTIIRIDDQPYQVVGVMPKIDGTRYTGLGDLWLPLAYREAAELAADRRSLLPVARLKPESSVDRAAQELSAISAQLARESPKTHAGYSATVETVSDYMLQEARPAVLAVFVAVMLVLVLACANIASLFAARLAERSREFAVRLALGAGGVRIARQLLIENALLATIGGIAGVIAAHWALKAMVILGSDRIPRIEDAAISPSVLAFSAVATGMAALISGSVPIFTLGTSLSDSLREGGRSLTQGLRQRRVRDWMVGAQVAVAFTLLIAAGLTIRSLSNVLNVDPGFRSENVLTMSVALPKARYTSNADKLNFYRRAQEQLRSLPGVRSATAGYYLPLRGGQSGAGVSVEGWQAARSNEAPRAFPLPVDAEYFRTLGIELRRGRFFTDRESLETGDVAVISEEFARRYFAGQDALGKRVSLSLNPTKPEDWKTIVGITGDIRVRSRGLEAATDPVLYVPLAARVTNTAVLAIWTAVEPGSLAPAARRMLRELDAALPVSDVQTLGEVVLQSTRERRFAMYLLFAFGLIALVLAAVGLYGVVANAVTRRTEELGIRLAMGAPPTSIFALVLRHGFALAAAGIAAGLLIAIPAAKLLSNLLFGVAWYDPAVISVTGLLIFAIAAAACLIPAIRATRIDPVEAIRGTS
jgi:putative ABC transport system permease protein